MRGNYAHELKQEPGTCGGCVHFRRSSNGDHPSALGKCAVKPKRWAYSQCLKACKKHYKDRRDNQ